MKQPKVIFLDAVGTLFGVRGSVGEVYRAIAGQMGVDASAEALDQAFRDSFKSAERMEFPGADPLQIPDLEYQWWEAIAQKTFTKAGIIDEFADFNAFFAQLYAHFATAEPWYIYPDVLPSLQNWHKKGIELGIISNFDTRLYSVLEQLQLKDFFSSITISSVVGAAKPDSKIFTVAMQKHNCIQSQACHIGDSQQEDYDGAKAIGLRAFLLQR